MKGIKKGMLLALSLAMAATLFAACGGEGDDNSSAADSSVETSTSVDGDVSVDGDTSDNHDSASNSDTSEDNSSDVGGDNDDTSDNNSSDVGGDNGDTSSDNSADVGGDNGDTSSDNSSEIGGDNDDTSSDNSSEIGGDNDDTSSDNSSEIGGDNDDTSDNNSSEIGGDNGDTSGGDDDTSSGDQNLPDAPTTYEKVDAAGWEAAINATNAETNFTVNFSGSSTAYSSENSIFVEDVEGYWYIADGKVYGVTVTNGITEYLYSGNVDGKNYEWKSEDEENWDCYYMGDAYPIDAKTYFSERIPESLTFDMLTFDEVSGLYSYDINDGESGVVGIRDGKIVYCEIRGNYSLDVGFNVTMEQVAYIAYGNASVGELPPVKDVIDMTEDDDTSSGDSGVNEGVELPDTDVEITEPEGEQVDEAAWNAAWENTYNATNFIAISEQIGPDVDERQVIYVADGMFFSEYTMTGGEVEYTFMGYVKENGYTWESTDGENWTAYEGGLPDGYAEGGFILETFSAANDFANALFSDNRRTYVIEMSTDEEVLFYEVKIANGYIVAIDRYYGQEKWCITFEYGNAVIGELPPVGSEESGGGSDIGGEEGGDVVLPDGSTYDKVDAAGWEAAINATNAATNFQVMIVSDSMDVTESGEIISTSDNMQIYIADGKGYSVMTGGDGTQYSYAGNVDGRYYEWYSQDNITWECCDCGEAQPINGSKLFGDMIPETMTFENSVYMEDNGFYICQYNAMEFIMIAFKDGKVAAYARKVDYKEQGFELTKLTTYVFFYDIATVGELPPVGNNGGVESGDDDCVTSEDNAGVGEEETVVDGN